MAIHTTMPKGLRPFYQKELSEAHTAFARQLPQKSWYHLERAHILGQPYPMEHTAVHWRMLLFGFRIKNTREILGQIPRLLVGGVKSFVGKIPVGNTGGADVPPLRPMEIPEELRHILNRYSR